MTFKDRQLNSMTFQAWKMKCLNSMTFQVFHDLYEPVSALQEATKNVLIQGELTEIKLYVSSQKE